MKQTVVVWGKPIEIDVYQKSKSVFIATGVVNGKHIEVKRSTPGAAASGWADAAKYHSN